MYLSFLTKNWKWIASVIVLVVTAITSYYYGKGNAEQKVIVKTEVVEKIVEKEQKNTHKTKDTEIIKMPDGTERVVIREKEDTTAVIDRKTNKKDSHNEVTETKPAPRFKAGIIASAPTSEMRSIEHIAPKYSIVLGVRAVGPIWLEGLYAPLSREAGIGISIEL